MSEFIYKSRGLETKYVYYDWLDEYYPLLKRNISTEFWRIKHQTANISSVTTQLMGLAQQEQNKERRLLKQYFGIETNYDLENFDNLGDFVRDINKIMNLSDVYERNKQVIHNTNMKNITADFPTYFIQEWDAIIKEGDIIEELSKLLVNDASVQDAADSIFPKYIEKATIRALQYMFTRAKAEHVSLRNDQTNQAYQELVDAIGDLNTPGMLASEFYRIYHLDELKRSLISGFKTQEYKLDSTRIASEATIVKNNFYQRGGLVAEVMAAVKAKLAGNKNVVLKGALIDSIVVGSHGAKADSILTYGFDAGVLEEAMEKMAGSIARTRNVQFFSELGTQLARVPDNFIVYVNSKNYTLGEGFKRRGGFSSGEDLDAATYENLFKNIDANIETFVGAMMQLGDGAIGAGESWPFEKIIATNVAYLLFDDFTTIGEGDAQGNALHVMDLNGIIIPLSVILSALAQAIREGEKDGFREVVDVHIKAPSTLFKNIDEERDYVMGEGGGNWHSAWEHQSKSALKNTKIATRFLRNFQELVRKYL